MFSRLLNWTRFLWGSLLRMVTQVLKSGLHLCVLRSSSGPPEPKMWPPPYLIVLNHKVYSAVLHLHFPAKNYALFAAQTLQSSPCFTALQWIGQKNQNKHGRVVSLRHIHCILNHTNLECSTKMMIEGCDLRYSLSSTDDPGWWWCGHALP